MRKEDSVMQESQQSQLPPVQTRESDRVAGQHDFREFLKALEEAGELERWSKPISLRDVGRLIESREKALLIERPSGYSIPILANVMASRRAWAIAFGVKEPSEILAEMRRRTSRLVPPVRVSTGPVKEVVQIKEKADLVSLPAYLQHEFDGSVYISAAMDVSRHPETNGYNVGVRRLMVRGPRETGIDMVSPTDLRSNYRRARELGKKFPIAMVVGTHPLNYLGSQWAAATENEYEVLGAMRGKPIELVSCETVDIEVPADAEIVLEGYLEGDWAEVEGPFGEYHGGYGQPHINPVFRLTAITRREDALFQTATIGGRRHYFTDTAGIACLVRELRIWLAVAHALRPPVQVYCPPAGALHHARISIKNRDPGDGRNALAAALANTGLKMAVVVDDDIDVYDDRMVEWALSTRFQADRDTVILSGMRCIPIEPSLPPHEGSNVTTAAIGFDATRRYDKPAHVFDIPRAPFAGQEIGEPKEHGRVADLETLTTEVVKYLREGPRFVDLLARFPQIQQPDLIAAIGHLRERKMVRLGTDGRYWATGEQPGKPIP
jgi:UbiD family decarboxylase